MPSYCDKKSLRYNAIERFASFSITPFPDAPLSCPPCPGSKTIIYSPGCSSDAALALMGTVITHMTTASINAKNLFISKITFSFSYDSTGLTVSYDDSPDGRIAYEFIGCGKLGQDGSLLETAFRDKFL